jgi:hypothetical protein
VRERERALSASRTDATIDMTDSPLAEVLKQQAADTRKDSKRRARSDVHGKRLRTRSPGVSRATACHRDAVGVRTTNLQEGHRISTDSLPRPVFPDSLFSPKALDLHDFAPPQVYPGYPKEDVVAYSSDCSGATKRSCRDLEPLQRCKPCKPKGAGSSCGCHQPLPAKDATLVANLHTYILMYVPTRYIVGMYFPRAAMLLPQRNAAPILKG